MVCWVPPKVWSIIHYWSSITWKQLTSMANATDQQPSYFILRHNLRVQPGWPITSPCPSGVQFYRTKIISEVINTLTRSNSGCSVNLKPSISWNVTSCFEDVCLYPGENEWRFSAWSHVEVSDEWPLTRSARRVVLTAEINRLFYINKHYVHSG